MGCISGSMDLEWCLNWLFRPKSIECYFWVEVDQFIHPLRELYLPWMIFFHMHNRNIGIGPSMQAWNTKNGCVIALFQKRLNRFVSLYCGWGNQRASLEYFLQITWRNIEICSAFQQNLSHEFAIIATVFEATWHIRYYRVEVFGQAGDELRGLEGRVSQPAV